MDNSKPKKKSITEEYLEYYEKYIDKFGKERMLVLMQVGSFYEAYATKNRGPCLKTLEELTDATIAHKGKDKNKLDINNPLMWGFPKVASLKFINILIENGYRLIMIDQVTPKPNIKREVVAIHSPATYLESTYRPTSKFVSNIYIEEVLQRNGCVLACVGMSAIDVSTGEVYVHESISQSCDDKIGLDEASRFLKGLCPKEIIIIKENLQKTYDDYLIEYFELRGKFYQIKEYNKEFNELKYQKKVLEKVYPDRENMTSIIDTIGISKTIYARKSFVNLLIYISDQYESLIKSIYEPKFYLNATNLILGNDAINQLNIVDNNLPDIGESVKFHNLLDVINKARTGMGKRYIKMRLISPYTEPKILNQIYTIVDTLIENDYYSDIDNYLKRIHDIERLYRKLSIGLLQPTQLVDLINSCQPIYDIYSYLTKNAEFLKISHLIGPFNELINRFDKYINIDKCKLYNLTDIKENIFKEGIYPELDLLYDQICDNHGLMEQLLNKLDEMIYDKNAKNKKIVLKHNKRDGYYYQTTIKRYKSLESNCGRIEINKKTIDLKDFNVSEFNNNVKLSLPFLKNQTADIGELLDKVTNLTYEYYVKFLKSIDTDFGEIIRESIDIITKIDYYATIARVSKEYNYVRPKIKNTQNKKSYLSVKNIRHPIVERIIDHEYIPHSIQVGQDLKGILIYGLNSAGKSVLMKAIGISIIMAQAGFYVPASSYTYYPYRALYTRITGNDNLYRGLSSFSLEMVELNAILKRSNDSTIVIGDEVCRGTEHISGNAIVASTLLKLSSLNSSFVFATHLHELMELEEIKSNSNIKAFHLSVKHDDTTDRLIYDRELKPGTGERIYGITVAKYIIKDTDFIKNAYEIKNRLLNYDLYAPVISTKKSRYNSDLIMDECAICGKKNINTLSDKLETHHINQQKDCEYGFVKNKSHIKKNQIFNLIATCNECHDKIHNKKIFIDGIKMTSNGKKVIINENKLALCTNSHSG